MTEREICVCIPTHRRPRELERLLGSLIDQQGAPPFEVVVVDNDAGRSGETVALKFRDRLALTYLVEPVRGLARVRNRSVAASNSRFLALLDDDEWASPRWLEAYHRVATSLGAAGVMGPIDTIFADEVPDYIRQCGLFHKRAYADGEAVPWYDTRTGNAFIRRDALPSPTAPFSTKYDLVGGEDVDLFKRMHDAGVRFHAAAQALAFEFRPASRANLFFVLRRALRNGGNTVEFEGMPRGVARRFRGALRAGVEGMRQARKARRLWRRDRMTAARELVSASHEIGKAARLTGIRIKEYRKHH
jgi:succinoglycan biosynthesis protein ExoM